MASENLFFFLCAAMAFYFAIANTVTAPRRTAGPPTMTTQPGPTAGPEEGSSLSAVGLFAGSVTALALVALIVIKLTKLELLVRCQTFLDRAPQSNMDSLRSDKRNTFPERRCQEVVPRRWRAGGCGSFMIIDDETTRPLLQEASVGQRSESYYNALPDPVDDGVEDFTMNACDIPARMKEIDFKSEYAVGSLIIVGVL